ncbi:metal ABC transporter substrate-binding protein [Bartonella sp. DGB1]|uniref:metal ABC transporter substrate-binding protein n=1 Tax=Bartonella sp. DGB1 TaxID=3239807 RepID=UPI003525B2FC
MNILLNTFRSLAVLLLLTPTITNVMAEKKMYVVTSFTIIKDIAKNVAGDAAIVESVIKEGMEVHEYDPTPKDIIKAHKADLILWNGLNLELWFERFFAQLKNTPAVVVTENIVPLPILEGEYEGKPNPHAWLSPKNAMIYVENIRKAFVKYDPDNADIYNKNAYEYTQKIKQLDKYLRDEINKIPVKQRWLVTSEGAFSYLIKDYNMKELYLWPVNGDEIITPKHLKHVIDTVEKYNIPVVFSESTVSDRPMKQVANSTKAKYGGVLYVDSLTGPKGVAPTYLDLLNVTIKTILKGYNK